MATGFKTFKVKVGLDVSSHLKRLCDIQSVERGQAKLRIDANRAYSQEDAIIFSTKLDPADIELFEQPCAADNWHANAKVAKSSVVPVMLDESICSIADIERAAELDGVGYCKLKLKRFGGLSRLREALEFVRTAGMAPVLGDGLGCEIVCWMEACVGVDIIDNAGEFNGYLKPHLRLFEEPLEFGCGQLLIPPNYRPRLKRTVLDSQSLEYIRLCV